MSNEGVCALCGLPYKAAMSGLPFLAGAVAGSVAGCVGRDCSAPRRIMRGMIAMGLTAASTAGLRAVMTRVCRCEEEDSLEEGLGFAGLDEDALDLDEEEDLDDDEEALDEEDALDAEDDTLAEDVSLAEEDVLDEDDALDEDEEALEDAALLGEDAYDADYERPEAGLPDQGPEAGLPDAGPEKGPGAERRDEGTLEGAGLT